RSIRAQSGRMVVPVNGAVVRAAAVQHQLRASFLGLMIATDGRDRRPVRHRRGEIWCKGSIVVIAMDDLAAEDGENGPQVDDVAFGYREIVVGEHGKIGQLPGYDLPLFALLV